jgi:hypothetical protein
MARAIQLTIQESQQELEQHLSHQRSASGKERVQMLYWLKRGIAKNRKREIATSMSTLTLIAVVFNCSLTKSHKGL